MGRPRVKIVDGKLQCVACQRWKKLTLFHICKRNSSGRQAACKACKKKRRPTEHQLQYTRQKLAGLGSYRFSQARGCAKSRGRSWGLTAEAYYALVALPCHYCGDKLTTFGVGLDRIDNAKGYEPGNVLPACRDCNHTRSNRFSVEEMLLLGAVIRTIKQQRGTL